MTYFRTRDPITRVVMIYRTNDLSHGPFEYLSRLGHWFPDYCIYSLSDLHSYYGMHNTTQLTEEEAFLEVL